MSVLLRRAGLRYHAGRPGLLALAILGIAVGVSVVVGIDVASTSARRAFTRSADAVTGRATHVVTGPARGVPDSIYVALRTREAIRTVTPVMEGGLRLASDGSRLSVLGIDPVVDGAVRPWSAGGESVDPGRLLTRPDAALLTRQTAARIGVGSGDTLTVRADGRTSFLVVAGLIEPPDPVAAEGLVGVVVLDVAAAQELLGSTGYLSRLDVVAPNQAAVDHLASVLPEGYELESATGRTETLEQMTRAFDLNLRALSYLALLVGLFLVYNIVSFSVVRRRTVLGRLRAIGVRRTSIERLILFEALLLGLAGTAVGLGLGVLLGGGLVRLVTRSINDLYFTVSVQGVAVGPLTLAKALALGVVASLLAAWGPARRAARAPTAGVMRRSDEEERLRGRFGVMLRMSAGCLLAGIPLLVADSGIVGGYAGLLAIVASFALVTPPVVERLAALLAAAHSGTTWRMAVGGVRTRLARTSVAVAALSLAVAAAVGVGVMVESFRSTVDTWLRYSLQADLYAQAPGLVTRRGGGALDSVLVRQFRTDPDIRASYGVRRTTLATGFETVDLVAIEHGPETHETFRFRDVDSADLWAELDGGDAVAVSEPFAIRHGVAAGDSILAGVPGGDRRLHVAAIYYDYGSDLGAVLLGRPAYDLLFDDPLYNGLALFVRDGVDAGAVGRRLESAARKRQDLIVRTNVALRQASLEVFDRTFAVTAVLRLLAVVVAVVGIVGALSALQLDRAFEYGVLRAMGLRRSALVRIVALESGIMGFIAGLLALPLGLALAAGLVYVINRRSFGWTLQFDVDPGLLLQAVSVSVAAGLVAAIVPALRLRALRVPDLLRTGTWILLAVSLAACNAEPRTPSRPLQQSLGIDTTGYLRAVPGRPFGFPADHGAHPGYRLEWWYFTGNLDAPDGRAFGYQFTVFRTALRPPGPAGDRTSGFAADQLYMAHVAVTDATDGRFLYEERLSRGAAGLAGVRADPFRVWLEDWEAEATPGFDTLRVRVAGDDLGLDLRLVPSKPIVLQGDGGWSPKGSEPGQASYYYAITRLATDGTVRLGAGTVRVSGLSWLDREWSTSLLSAQQSGWDWFSLQFDDGRDLMYFRLRGPDRASDFVDGSIVDSAGERVPFNPEGVTLEETGRWRSPHTEVSYPSGWTLASESDDFDLRITPLVRDQELDLRVRYWEGAVRVEGRLGGRPVRGRGYVELTGYDQQE